jgi:homoserine kinase type II
MTVWQRRAAQAPFTVPEASVAVYTHLARDEVAAFLAAFGLGPPTRLEGVPAGSINTNYLVEAEGMRFFLRLNEVATEADLRYEAELLSHLQAKRTPTPALLRTLAGPSWAPLHGRMGSLFGWAEGRERSAHDATRDDLWRVARALARLHAAASDFPLRRPHAFGEEAVSRWIDEIVALRREDLADTVPLLVKERDHLRQARDPTLPRGVIHGDLFPDNVKFDARGEVSLLFDFEMASDGVLAYDVAVCLLSWCWERGFDWPRVRAFLAGYASARPLGTAELAGLYAEMRQGALRFMVTRIRDFHLRPVPAQDRVPKDFRDYRDRLRALREIGPEEFAARIRS